MKQTYKIVDKEEEIVLEEIAEYASPPLRVEITETFNTGGIRLGAVGKVIMEKDGTPITKYTISSPSIDEVLEECVRFITNVLFKIQPKAV